MNFEAKKKVDTGNVEINKQIENGNITPKQVDEFVNDDRKAAEIEPIVKAIESKTKSNTKVELEEIVSEVDSLINNQDNGIIVLPSERANEAQSNLVIVQSSKYYTLWLKSIGTDKRTIYTYLTILSRDINEARKKANNYINDLANGKKLSMAFAGKNLAGIGEKTTIALSEEIIQEEELGKIVKSKKGDAKMQLPEGLETKIGFGKYGNLTAEELIETDLDYAKWVVENSNSKRIVDILKQHPTFQQIADEKELDRERIKAFEERESKRSKGENVPVSTLVRGETGKIEEVVEETKSTKKPVAKVKNRKAKDQIKDIVPPNTKAKDNVSENLKENMFPSQIDGANTAIQSLNTNGVVLNGDGAGVGKTRQIVAVADYYAKKGKYVIIISENAAIGKPFEKVGAYKLGGSMEKDSQEMGVKINLLEGPVEKGKIYISTYNRIKENNVPEGAVIIFDESQNLANTFGRNPDANAEDEQKQWETKFKAILNKSDKVAYYSATPADKPHQLAYLYKMLGFASPEDFLTALVANGAVIKTRRFGREEFKYYDVPSSATQRKKLYDWVNGLMVQAGVDGRFIKREISYEGTDVQFHDVTGLNEQKNPFAKLFNQVISEMSDAQKIGYKLLAPNSYILYAAELSKIGEAVKMAKREKEAGRKVVLFVSRIKPMEIRGKIMQSDGQYSDAKVVGSIPSPVDLLREDLAKEGISFVELHGSSKMSSQKAQKEFSENADALIASVESGGTGINLDDTVGNNPRTIIFMFSPYRGISTIQAMGRIWRASTIQDDEKPNRFVFVTASDIAPDLARSGVLAKKLQLMNAMIGGTAVAKLPMAKSDYDVSQLVGIELPDSGEESAIVTEKTGILKPVDIQFKKSAKGNYWSPANADILEWYERGGPERTGLDIRVFKGSNGEWVAMADRQYEPQEFAPEGINGDIVEKNKKLSDKVRNLKIDLGKIGDGGLQSNPLGLPVGIWNVSMDIIATSIDAGMEIGEAIKRGLNYIQKNNRGQWNKKQFNDEVLKELGVRGIEINGQDIIVKPQTKEDAKVVDGFYSDIEKALIDTKKDNLTASEWETIIGKTDEAKFTGLDDFINSKEGEISKAEIREYLNENRIEISEVVLGGDQDNSARLKEIEDELTNKGYSLETDMGGDGIMLLDEEGELVEYDEIPSDILSIYEEYTQKSDSGFNPASTVRGKFEDKQLEGEKENYKEILVTLPIENKGKYNKANKEREEIFAEWNKQGWTIVDARQKDPKSVERLNKANQILNESSSSEFGQGKFRSSHFDEANILVHLRMNTRIDADGNKVLFLEEVQSDWGQKGKKEGFVEKLEKTNWKAPRVVNGNKVYDSEKEDFTIIDRGNGNISLLNKDSEELFDGKYTTVEEAKEGADNESSQYGRGAIPTAPAPQCWGRRVPEAVNRLGAGIAWRRR
jgi:hypothetical protein